MTDFESHIEDTLNERLGVMATQAARIAELEAALRKLYDHEGQRVLNGLGIECNTEELDDALNAARAALEGGKKDEATPSA